MDELKFLWIIPYKLDKISPITNGKISLTDVDQLNIKAIYDTVKSGAKSALYHADGKLCRAFTDEEIIKLMEASMKYVTYNTTLCNHLHVQVLNAKTKENIVNVEFSVNSLKDTYKESFNTIVNM